MINLCTIRSNVAFYITVTRWIGERCCGACGLLFLGGPFLLGSWYWCILPLRFSKRATASYAIDWLRQGHIPDNRCGIERRAAYQRNKLFDPLTCRNTLEALILFMVTLQRRASSMNGTK